MSLFKKSLVLAVFCLSLILPTAAALAYNPALSVYNIGGGNSAVSITNAQPNAGVVLSYVPAGSSLTTTITGNTDYNGNFSTTINSASGSQVTATVAGQFINSNNSGCGYNGCGGCTYNCGTGSLSLSQTSLTLNSGQSSTVTVYNNNYGGTPYISSNSNSSVATASVSGNNINVYGQNSGSTTISICQNSSSQCASLYVTVNGNGGCTYNCTGNLTLSQTNVNLNVGQTSYITASVSTYNPTFYISSNSNSSVVTATVSGGQISLYGLNAGSSTVSVCSNSGSVCASVYVTVGGGNNGGGNVWFSPTSANLYTGQSLAVSLNSASSGANYGSTSNPYYVSTNSNPSVVSASISGTVLNLYANQAGSSSITVCLNSLSFCGNLPVTVNGNGSGSGSLSLSQTSVTLNSGQTSTVTAYNVPQIYISSNSNSSVVTANVSNLNQINLYGQSNGSATVYVCGTNSSQCASIYVIVNGSGSGNNSSVSFSPNYVNLNFGQSQSVAIYSNNNYSNNYYISSNSSSGVVSASISGSSLNLYGQSNGSTTITVCQTGYSSNCGSIYVTVGTGYNGGGASGSLYFNTTTLPLMTLGQYYTYQLQANGGSSPYSYYLASGNLPYGLSLSQNGLISGVPNSNTYASFQVRVNDAYGRTTTASFSVGNNNGCTYNCGGLSYPGSGGVLGASNYPSGELISEGPTVYMVYKNLKTAFANSSAFLGLGFNFNNVVAVGNSGLINSGYIVASSNVQHPWGTWVKSGSTIYFVHEQGLIAVPDWNTFLNNGGQSNFVVPANYYDLRLPRLSVMVNGDSRLQ